MEQSNLFTALKPKSYLRLAVTIFLFLFAGKFVINHALPYYGFDQETFGRFWNYKWPLIGHITFGLLALIIGPFQFWEAFRMKFMAAHRKLGIIYLLSILIGTISSTILAWTSAYKVNFSWAFSLQGLAFVWILSAAMAYLSVLRKRINQHKEWMIRSYVVTFGFVTFRWLNELTFVKDLMPEFGERGPTLGWFCWAIPLFITEIVLNWKKK